MNSNFEQQNQILILGQNASPGLTVIIMIMIMMIIIILQ